MKIKQQKQIKVFLIKEFGNDNGNVLFTKQDKRLNEIIKGTKNKTTITKCLWHTACVENGCPELCRLFCDVDDVTYGGLNKIGFSRTKTLGYGGDCCDFHFFRK